MSRARKARRSAWGEINTDQPATMIKDAGLNLNAGLGPKLDTLDAKWGTKDGQKAADDIKKNRAEIQDIVR